MQQSPPGWGAPNPAWGPWPPQPPQPQPSNRARVVVIVVSVLSVLTVLAVIGGAVAIMLASTPYPSDWDPRVEEYVRFVEQERGLTFDNPVYVDFLDPDEFDSLVTNDEAETTEEDRAYYEEVAASLRALGLHEGPLDVEEETDQLYESGVLAYYSSDDKRIRVKGTELTPDVAVTLVHELVHALQDQHFDLSKLDTLDTSTAQAAFRTVVEGDAVWVEDQYVLSLPASEQEAIELAETSGAEEAQAEIEDLNEVLVTSFSAPYILGPPYLQLLHAEGGYDAVDRRIRDEPADEAAIFDPQDHLSGTERPTIEPPALPEGADAMTEDEQLVATDSLGALTFFMMLAARLDAHEAMAATDLLAGDLMLTYTQDDRTCVALDVVAASGSDADDLEDALDRWADAMPPEAGATADRSDSTIEVRSCDPGEDVSMGIVGSPADAVGLPTVRLYLLAGALDEGATEDEATCFAETFVDGVTVEDLIDESAEPEDFDDLRADAFISCMR